MPHQTVVYHRDESDIKGRRTRYGGGSFHTLDAAKLMILDKELENIEAALARRAGAGPGPVRRVIGRIPGENARYVAMKATVHGTKKEGFTGSPYPLLPSTVAHSMAPRRPSRPEAYQVTNRLPTSVGTSQELLLELALIKAAIRSWHAKQPDEVISAAPASSCPGCDRSGPAPMPGCSCPRPPRWLSARPRASQACRRAS